MLWEHEVHKSVFTAFRAIVGLHDCCRLLDLELSQE